MMLLIKLLLAHLIGDFFLQPKKWVKEKEKKKLKSLKLYLHIAIHFALLFLILWDMSLWPIILVIGFLHFIIDTIKLIFQNKKNKRLFFFMDQILHVLVIVVTYFIYTKANLDFNSIFSEQNILLITSLVFLTKPASLIIDVFLSKWDVSQIVTKNGSFKNAGVYIGVLERLLVFIFIIINQWEAVGFLITAKSVFSFGNLKESKQRKLTEYVLIGTLISFGIAITIGLIFNALV
ncbi:DUF3307 domain-containing protein [Flavobacteriaceae bacterium S0825]|uniref:DUF3307 domain-containing protein n=1 Tax=Gaetbulibacter sp. S0825 TaxID=2720084 RepID=UPI0014322010|nr:DUF3307 domain-containing protein [Gaetbulibacter sp. S0825]MCK0109323.1 DUF3307 domain-containing protein [Flavobacteriaceae bacterium S0825]NIX64957.1 DUF3307 domain-containing protein [Gaetbulibacter sp. S0825]